MGRKANADTMELGGFTVAPSEGIVRASREAQPNPLEPAVLQSLEGPLCIAVSDDEQAKYVKNLVRRAANAHGLGLSVQYRDGAIHFQASQQKRERKYTAEQIREWALAEGYGDYAGVRVPSDVREAFKQAHGF